MLTPLDPHDDKLARLVVVRCFRLAYQRGLELEQRADPDAPGQPGDQPTEPQPQDTNRD